MIQVKNMTFSYNGQDEAIKNVSFSIEKGSFVSIVGHNGSGKSTMAKLLVGLLKPSSGTLAIDDLEYHDHNMIDIRKKVGIVFQNPDNQFVGVTVRHDIAFGLENQQLQPNMMEEKVLYYASLVGMERFLDKEPHQLSGGQKQRVAIASALAMEQEIIIFDEATSMLDPKGVKDMMETIMNIHKKFNKTIIMITHDLRQAGYADEMLIMKDGALIAKEKPAILFQDVTLLRSTQLLLPFELELYEKAKELNMSEKVIHALWAYNSKT
jgi:energy-coupling factor transport system ATP-binding protein